MKTFKTMYSHEHGCKGRGFFDCGNESCRNFLEKAVFIDANQCLSSFFIRKIAFLAIFALLQNLDGDGLELLPSGAVGDANHEMIVAGRGVGRDFQVVASHEALHLVGNFIRECRFPRGSLVVVVVAMFVVVTFVVVVALGAVAVVVEIAVDFEGIAAQSAIVGEHIVECDDLATMVGLAVDGVGGNAFVGNNGRCHVAGVIACFFTSRECHGGCTD